MLFNSYQFLLVFLPAAIAICRATDASERWRTWALILLSLVFYGYWDVRFLPLMVASILFNWLAARLYIASRRHAVIAAAVIANLVVLGIFKYTDFFIESFAALFGLSVARLNIALPLGISFFTFHHIMYLVDLGRGKAPVYPLDRYALYICFFPQSIAGPIARWNEVIHQFGQRVFSPGWERRCAAGAIFIVVGLLQKVAIGDPLASAIDPIYTAALTNAVSAEQSWLALVFAFQVYFDFSAYSDIAIGVALVFGVRLPPNFNGPFRATSILEFWRRWHVTLARFLRDYVFAPLSTLRVGGREHRIARLMMALLATMALCGLWHGAGWNYVLWGTLQGIAMVIATAWSRYFPPMPSVLGWIATVGFFVLTIVIFRSGSLEAAWTIYQGLASWPGGHFDGRNLAIIAFATAVLLPPTQEICRRLTVKPSRLVAVGTGVAGILVLLLLGNRENYQFIYFQF
jgi:alginate O-acetyltransferase complex protein AlgI